MLLRDRADRRTLFWAFALFPLGPLVAYARPELALWTAPLVLYTSYCSGVLTHNHNHRAVFERRALNAVYAAWLSLFYGVPIFTWIPTHNRNHHRYRNGPGDRTSTMRLGSDTLARALVYPLLSSAWQLPALREHLRASRTRARMLLEAAAVVGGHGALLALAVWLHGWSAGAVVYAVSLGLPALLAPWFMMFTNYVQHVGCDPASEAGHSRNFVSPLMNYLTFNGGYHTVHHEQPGLHWSLLPAAHAARAHAIPSELNAHTIASYCWDAYVRRAFSAGPGARARPAR